MAWHLHTRGAHFPRRMKKTLPIFAAAAALWLALPASSALAAPIDADGNTLDDAWETYYNATGLNPLADDDGDGFNNFQEMIAGTDPRNPASAPPNPSVTVNPDTSVTLRWASQAGKSYQVQTAAPLGSAWSAIGVPLYGTGGQLAATFGPFPAGSRAFRVSITNVDSDNDGLSDWAEVKFGFDPFRPDTFNTGLGDRETLANALSATNTVTVAVTDGVATAATGDTATLVFRRLGNVNAFTATYTVTGTGVSGTDYMPLSGTVTFPLGVNSVSVLVRLAAGATFTATKTVIATVAAAAGYTVGSPNAATVTLSPLPAAGQVFMEVWTGVGGYQLSDVPFGTPPQSIRLLPTIEIPQNTADSYGSRVRGWITAPTTGAYTFWVAADDIGEFWLANDDQPATLTRRCYTSYVGYRTWNTYATQKSALITLTAGQRYYFEALHREGSGGDHLSIGWLKPGQTGTAPSEIVGATGSVLSAYVAPLNPTGPTTLWFAPLARESGVAGSASGFGSVTLAADDSAAVVSLRTSSLSGAISAATLRGPADPGQTGPVIFDYAASAAQSDGTRAWIITNPAHVAALKQGRVYLSVATAAYPSGELRGQLGRSVGNSAAFTPPAAPPAAPTTAATDAEAARFLIQSTFGPTSADIAAVRRDGYAAWLDNQIATAPTYHTPYLDNLALSGQQTSFNSYQESWWKQAVLAPDQVRQRVAFALSELMVISSRDGDISNEPWAIAGFYDVLLKHGLGNYRNLLEEVTLHPAMGVYLDMLQNDKPDPATGQQPNENYGREVLQLFSLGLTRLHPDGSIVLDSSNNPVPTYGQNEVIGYAHVFTGWNFAQVGTPQWLYVADNWRQLMQAVPGHHDTDAKLLLDGVTLPSNRTAQQDLKDALDVVFNHPTCGVFVSRHLIQRLVTSNPSPGYIYRVAQKFADNGQGVRGDLGAVVRQIFLDYEARTPANLTNNNFGKQREPLVRLANLYRAFNARAYNNRWQLFDYDLGPNYGQTAMQANSVFNFFSPFYSLPGEIAAAGLTSPEYQITTETQVVSSSNNLRAKVALVASPGSPATIGFDLSAQVAIASNATTLVDSLNTVLLAGQMSSGLRTQVINAVSGTTDPLARAQRAVQFIATSPEFCVQK